MKAQSQRATGRLILVGASLIAGALTIRSQLLPAQIRALTVSDVTGDQPAIVRLSWGYGPGARPISLIIDLAGQGGQRGSLTVGGQARSAELPLASELRGAYTLTTTSTYRLIGVARRATQHFTGAR